MGNEAYTVLLSKETAGNPDEYIQYSTYFFLIPQCCLRLDCSPLWSVDDQM